MANEILVWEGGETGPGGTYTLIFFYDVPPGIRPVTEAVDCDTGELLHPPIDGS